MHKTNYNYNERSVHKLLSAVITVNYILYRQVDQNHKVQWAHTSHQPTIHKLSRANAQQRTQIQEHSEQTRKDLVIKNIRTIKIYKHCKIHKNKILNDHILYNIITQQKNLCQSSPSFQALNTVNNIQFWQKLRMLNIEQNAHPVKWTKQVIEVKRVINNLREKFLGWLSRRHAGLESWSKQECFS